MTRDPRHPALPVTASVFQQSVPDNFSGKLQSLGFFAHSDDYENKSKGERESNEKFKLSRLYKEIK